MPVYHHNLLIDQMGLFVTNKYCLYRSDPFSFCHSSIELEFVQGGELFSVLHPAHPPKGMDGVPDHAAKFYGAGVLLAISYLHNEKNIAYRDMKPGTSSFQVSYALFITSFA
jgi:serine/threonine protein kinase